MSTAEVCADCGVPLVAQGEAPAAKHLDPSDDEVGYDLDDWEPDQRGELVGALILHGIAHRWEEGELVVRDADADTVEPLIDAVDNPDALDVEDDDDDAAAELMSSIYVAADVLASDGANPGAVTDLIDAEAEALEIDAPFGISPDTWAEIKRQTSLLTALLDDGGEEVDIRLAARELRDFLHPMV